MAEVKSTKTTKAVQRPDEVNVNQYIRVRNGFHGMFLHRSSRTDELFKWNEYGDVLDMELIELRSAKSTHKEAFINNYFMFDEEYDWVIDYLGVRQYYKDDITVEGVLELMKKSPAKVKKIISDMPEGKKRSFTYRITQMIHDGDIDSVKAIRALEEALGIELIEN